VLRGLYSAYFERLGEEDRKNPFSRLRFEESDGRKREPFSDEWIQGKILAPGALAGMNDLGRAILLAPVETGCRPAELCNIVPEDIFLDAEVPYIHVRARINPDDTRDIKTGQSDRSIPIVGVALDVFRRHPNGGSRYKDNSYSAAANKYLKEWPHTQPEALRLCVQALLRGPDVGRRRRPGTEGDPDGAKAR